jgi:dynein heavy chain, axonemal
MAVKLNEVYQEQYKLTKDKLLAQPKNKQFEFDEHRIFFKFDLFCKRMSKLINMFSTMHQFSSLAQHTHIDGLDQVRSKQSHADTFSLMKELATRR